MKYAIICGSHRHQSQSSKIAHYIEREIRTTTDAQADVYLFSLEGNPLPLWDQGMWDGGEHWDRLWKPVAAELQTADAFVIVAPEWSGSIPSGLRNFFLLCSSRELGHKPALIVSVSAGMGGTYPVSELRLSTAKNTRICYIPDHVIIRHAESHFNPGPAASDEDAYMRKRLTYSLNILKTYGEALQQVRRSGVVDFKAYPNGM